MPSALHCHLFFVFTGTIIIYHVWFQIFVFEAIPMCLFRCILLLSPFVPCTLDDPRFCSVPKFSFLGSGFSADFLIYFGIQYGTFFSVPEMGKKFENDIFSC
jgi:hypothetical protein